RAGGSPERCRLPPKPLRLRVRVLQEDRMSKVWLYSMASIVSLAVLMATRHLGGEAGARFMGESIGLVIVLLSCQICFHLNGIDEFWIDSKPQVFIQKILKSGGTGLLIAALVFYIFPRLSPGYATAAASAC